jgi:hypothetical protein
LGAVALTFPRSPLRFTLRKRAVGLLERMVIRNPSSGRVAADALMAIPDMQYIGKGGRQ